METEYHTAELPVEKIDFPWLVFKLMDEKFAINSGKVTGILQLPDRIEKLPDAPTGIRGIFQMRGDVVPVLDLRILFGMTTLRQEYEDFQEMLDMRKEDHIHWAKELERCIQTGEPFTLATDPHKCAFGRWYDQFHSEFGSVNHHMKKLEEPHTKLHEAAISVFGCDQHHDQCKRDVCLKTVYKQVEEEYVPRVLQLLEDAKEVFRSSYREMAVVLSDDTRSIGVVVDEVLGARFLRDIRGTEELNRFAHLNYVSGVARDDGSLILLVNSDTLLDILSPLNDAGGY